MKALFDEKKRIYYILAVLLLLPALVLIRPLIFPQLHSSDTWKGYHVLLVEKKHLSSLQEIHTMLREAGFDEFISADTEEVKLFDYEGLVSLPLREIPQRLERQDARYDPYIRNIGQYFEGKIENKPAHVLYLRSGGGETASENASENASETASETAAKLSALREKLEQAELKFFIPSLNSSSERVYWILLLLNLLLLTVFLPRESRLLFLLGGGLPCIGIPQMGMTIFGMLVLQLIGWAVLAGWAGPFLKRHFNIGGENFRREAAHYLTAYLLLSLFSVLFAQLSGFFQSFFPPFLLQGTAMAVQLSLTYLFIFFFHRKVRRQHHTLFFPVALSPKRRIPSKLVWRSLVLLAGLILLPAAVQLAFAGASGRSVVYPFPEKITEELGFNWPALVQLEKNQQERIGQERIQDGGGETSGIQDAPIKLPDIRDYISHMAYQNGYLYGRSYKFPQPGEKISIPVYEKVGLRIIQQDKVLKIFTDKWYKDIIASASEQGIPRMLIAQGSPVAVHKGEIQQIYNASHVVKGYTGMYVLVIPVIVLMVSIKRYDQNGSIAKHQQRKGQKVA